MLTAGHCSPMATVVWNPWHGTLGEMAFGQQSGPPASPKQIAYLKSLLQAAGHDDFRTARHEFGLTQRQAGGKFTTGEASALIDRLTGVEPTEPKRGARSDRTAATESRRQPSGAAARHSGRAARRRAGTPRLGRSPLPPP